MIGEQHIVEKVKVDVDVDSIDIYDIMQDAYNEAEAVIKLYMTKTAHLTNVTFKVRNRAENRGETIVSYAHREGCDCIIIGSPSNDEVGELSAYVVNHAWIPVLVCPSKTE